MKRRFMESQLAHATPVLQGLKTIALKRTQLAVVVVVDVDIRVCDAAEIGAHRIREQDIERLGALLSAKSF